MRRIDGLEKSIPGGVIYAQVEQVFATQDYQQPGALCVRLIGVSKEDFHGATFNSEGGCRVFLVDIAIDRFVALLRVAPYGPPSIVWRSLSGRFDELAWPDGVWLRLDYAAGASDSGAYAYELFAGIEEPTNIKPRALSFQAGPVIAPSFGSAKVPSVVGGSPFELCAFKVGQGMCSLLHNADSGVFFDLGAGTPIKRPNYRRKQTSTSPPGSMFNDISTMSVGKMSLFAVISHMDSDHWRLLDWDSALALAIDDVFIPTALGATTLPFTSVHVKPSVHLLSNHTVYDGPKPLFSTHRSKPVATDRNGECLVVGVELGGTNLLPGDYVYTRMQTDGNPHINALAAATLNSVVVPHHGDTKSSVVTVSPKTPSHSPAFFSAGNHAGYGHPKLVSRNAHSAAGFDKIWVPPPVEDVLAFKLA
jgi:beta-lactamase superfamily II metal-dependent hydrolase